MTTRQILCRHCKFAIIPDGRDSWLHVDHRGYACRDAANVLLSTHAEPRPPPAWPLNSMDYGR